MQAIMSRLPARYSPNLLAGIAELKTENPTWGYRRIAAFMRHNWGGCRGMPSVYRVRQYLRALTP